jgi:hypothetical protein
MIRYLAVLVAAATGCVTPIAERDSPIGEIARDCVIRPPAAVAALDAPVSLEYPDRSLWWWEDVPLAGGTAIPGAAAWVTSVDAACSAGPSFVRDDTGAVASVLALTAAELAANAKRADGKRLALVPTGGVVAQGTGFLYYDLVERGPGPLDAAVLGAGLCTLAPDARRCQRVTTADGAPILWRGDERVLNRGGLLVADADAPGGARAVIAGCRATAALESPCVVSGVPMGQLTEPAAYQVYSAFRGWVDALTDATTVAAPHGQLTLAPYRDGFVATSLDIFDHEVRVQRSRRAVADYQHAITAFAVVPPDAWWFVRGGREHVGLRRDRDAIVVSYVTDGAAAPGLHLVEFRFFGDFE